MLEHNQQADYNKHTINTQSIHWKIGWLTAQSAINILIAFHGHLNDAK